MMPRVLFLLGAFVSGVLILLAAVIMTAGGHGWVGGVWSASAIITAPLAAAAWLSRDQPWARAIAILTVVLNVAADIMAVWLSSLGDVVDMFRHLAPLMIVWAVLWLGWQFVAVAALVRSSSHFTHGATAKPVV